jgi:trk system potassium uptake protein TrkA
LKVVIIGAGEVGYHIANRLALENKDVVIIDMDPAAVKRVSDDIDVQTVIGNGSSPMALAEAGVEDADILLAVTDSDESNLVACMMADIISSTTKKLARIRNADFDVFHERFREHAPHINTIINPDIEVVKTIRGLMSVPGAVDVGEFAGGKMKFVAVFLDRHSPLSGVRLSDLPEKVGVQRPLIGAVIRQEELIIPRGRDSLMPGDLIYFISDKERLLDTVSLFGKKTQPVHRVLIIGGGRIGYRLAKELEESAVVCKLIEKRTERCVELAEGLSRTVVLNGDGSDQGLLAEENISGIDVAVTLTGDEETNILTSLLVKRMGVPKAITRIDRFSYFPLMTSIGIQLVVSPRLSAINSILQHIRRGKVLSAVAIKGEQAEVIEALALKTSSIVSKPLKRLSFPKGALLAGIIRREKIIIPNGESIIEPEDRIIIFAKRQAIPRIEKLLAVKLEYL